MMVLVGLIQMLDVMMGSIESDGRSSRELLCSAFSVCSRGACVWRALLALRILDLDCEFGELEFAGAFDGANYCLRLVKRLLVLKLRNGVGDDACACLHVSVSACSEQ